MKKYKIKTFVNNIQVKLGGHKTSSKSFAKYQLINLYERAIKIFLNILKVLKKQINVVLVFDFYIFSYFLKVLSHL